jgi:protein O-GlcNAc transferase
MPTLAEVLALAVRHHQAGDLLAADQLCRHILNLDPQQVEALHLLGRIAEQRGQSNLAADYFQEVARLRPDHPEVQSHLATVRSKQGQQAEAACAQQALRLQPHDAGAHYNRGIDHWEQGRLAEAMASYQQALRLQPHYPEAHNNLGIVLCEQGKLNEAVVCYEQALRLRPHFAEAYNNLGSAHRKQGKLEKAAAC